MHQDKKNESMPKLKETGLVRYTTSQIKSDQNKFRLSHNLEYKNNECAQNYTPIWGIERKWSEKIENTKINYLREMSDHSDFEGK